MSEFQKTGPLPAKILILVSCLLMMPGPAPALTNPYQTKPVKFVDELPKSGENRITVVSARNFKPTEGYKIDRGLQPKFRTSHFAACNMGDSIFVKPMANLAPAMDGMPDGRSILVYVDGHGKTFDQILERGIAICKRFHVTLVIFDWPTDYMALRKTAYTADEVTPVFVKSMAELNTLHWQLFPRSSVSIIFHSMGNHILKNLVDQRLQDYLPRGMFSNIIMNAAAVKQFNHTGWVGRLHIQDRLYITVNDEDRTLHGAMVLRIARQLGTGFKGNPAGNATYVNFSDIATSEHNLFLGRSEAEMNNGQIFRFYTEAFLGKPVQLTPKTGFRENGSEMVYFAVPVEKQNSGSE